jgi:hypothetical protein
MFARVLMMICLLAACEKTDHEHIDKWLKTEKGPDKLKKAFADESIDPDLSAHAGVNLVKRSLDGDARTELEQMSQPRRVQVVAKMAPKLWEIARIEGDLNLPGPMQVAGKDMLFTIRKYADDATKGQIDTYLTDWYCVASYEGRAHMGSVQGATVLRTVGPPAGKKLIAVLNSLIAAPGQEKVKNKIGDELMLGLAASGNPDAVGYLLDVAKMDRGDETLGNRAMSALYKGYIDSEGLFDPADPAALAPHLDRLVKVAQDDSMTGEAADDALSLIRAVGPPQCVAPLMDMLAHPHKSVRFRYVIAQQALRCGGVKVVKQVVQGLPDGPYEVRSIQGTISGQIAEMTPKAEVLATVRELLDDHRTVVRWVAAETLGMMKSTEDVSRLTALEKSGDKLVGYWGDNADGKPEPTLGQRAKEIVAEIQKPTK